MAKAERFVTDQQGSRLAVILDVRTYKKLLEKAEELEDIRAYDAAKASKEKPVPYEEARIRILRRKK